MRLSSNACFAATIFSQQLSQKGFTVSFWQQMFLVLGFFFIIIAYCMENNISIPQR